MQNYLSQRLTVFAPKQYLNLIASSHTTLMALLLGLMLLELKDELTWKADECLEGGSKSFKVSCDGSGGDSPKLKWDISFASSILTGAVETDAVGLTSLEFMEGEFVGLP